MSGFNNHEYIFWLLTDSLSALTLNEALSRTVLSKHKVNHI